MRPAWGRSPWSRSLHPRFAYSSAPGDLFARAGQYVAVSKVDACFDRGTVEGPARVLVERPRMPPASGRQLMHPGRWRTREPVRPSLRTSCRSPVAAAVGGGAMLARVACRRVSGARIRVGVGVLALAGGVFTIRGFMNVPGPAPIRGRVESRRAPGRLVHGRGRSDGPHRRGSGRSPPKGSSGQPARRARRDRRAPTDIDVVAVSHLHLDHDSWI